MILKYGKLPPINKPSIKFADINTGASFDPLVDYIDIGGWEMLGNNTYGDCVAVTWANYRRLLSLLAGHVHYPDMVEVLSFYKTQNKGFPNDDNGMVIQTALEYLVKHGGPDGVKAVAFAKVDHANPDEVKAAIDTFGAVWVGLTVTQANEDQFTAGQPWDYDRYSNQVGGHSVIVGGYDSDQQGGDEKFVTWATETSFTDRFWTEQVDECWVVVWPEQLGTTQFKQGIDLQSLKDEYKALTGTDLVIGDPPQPPGAATFQFDAEVGARIHKTAVRLGISDQAWLTRHLRSYFGFKS